ncbi:MAG TPA: sodium:solute symporter family protein [Bacteroidetes bacterium]|nr:sodium:solute symporter family protein [Bacteroidota bacterium]
MTREIYREGLSGLWFQNIVLFITPFYWFKSILQRRARYMAAGDIYIHRFESNFLGALYAFYILVIAMYGGAMGYLLTGKTMEALMVKPPAQYTVAEKKSVVLFKEYKVLEQKQSYQKLGPNEQKRFDYLLDLKKQNKIHAYISYLPLLLFYFIYGAIVASYTILGGLFAAVITDVIQGLLIVFLSIVLIPVGLIKVGGFAGLHAHIPAYLFDLFGTAVNSQYTWYFVAAMATVNLIGLPPSDFTTGGSAKDDMSARMGMMIGSFSKRFMMIGWALTGLIAVALYAGQLSDPTMIWGHMTKDLLGVGFIGLMIAAIMAANMSTIDSQSLMWSAAFTKNILLPLKPNLTEKTQVLVGRGVILIVLLANVYFATTINNIFVMFKYILSVGTIIGPSLWLVYFWRRLNTKAVVTQMLLSILITVIVPNVVPSLNFATHSQRLTQQTYSKTVEFTTKAVDADVKAGRADHVGQKIRKTTVLHPTSIYFEKVVHENPENPDSPLVGIGAFRPQLFFVSLMGFHLEHMIRPQLDTISFAFDVIFPFILLFLIGFLTRPNSEKVLREFYARVHTPAVADKELDARLVQEAVDNPEIIERKKLFPGTSWEFWKPSALDIWGFVASWVIVAFIIFLYWVLVHIGA